MYGPYRQALFGLVVTTTLLLGCTRTHVDANDPGATVINRGRLKYGKNVSALRIGDQYLFRDVTPHIYVDGKSWSPKGDRKFADKMSWCDTSPNPKVEILRCFGDSTEGYKTTYVMRMKGNEVEVQKIDEGVGSVWIDSDGRWLLFKKLYLNVATGETIPIKGMPGADSDDGPAPVQWVIGVSPDRKTVVGQYGDPTTVGDETFVNLELVDTEAGHLEHRKVSLTKSPWLKDHEDPSDGMQPPPAPSKHFVWKKDGAGKDVLSVPELLEVVEVPKPR